MVEPVTRGGAVLHSLKEREALWQAILLTARDAIVSIDAKGVVTLFNHAAEEMFGYAADEVIGRNVAMLMPPPYRDEHDEYLRRYLSTGVAKAIGQIRRVEGRRSSGEKFPIELSVGTAATGDAQNFTAIIRDISAQVQARQALEAHARQQAAVAELGRVALTLTLPETMHAAVAIVAKTLAVEHAKILRCLGDRELLLVAGVGWKKGRVGRARVGAGRDSQAGYTLSVGAPVIVDDLATDSRFSGPPLLIEHGIASGVSVVIGSPDQPFGVLGAHARTQRRFSADDANFLQAIANVLAASVERERGAEEQRRLQKLAAESERLAEIGAITAKVVHDLGNPLAALSMQAQLLQRRLAQADPVEKMQAPVARILATVARLDELARDFSNFVREQRLLLASFDLGAFLEELVGLWEPVATAHAIELSLDLPSPLPPLRGDRAKLQRVFENVIKNAIEAIDTPGGQVLVSCDILSADRISISIGDNGPGMAEGIDVYRLFETTKVEGSGLGLAVARQIVVAHQGTISHHCRKPKGTEFCVTLPVAGPSA